MKIYGIDTMELNIEVVDYNEDFKNFLDLFDNMKKEAQEEYKEKLIKLENVSFVVKPKGQGFYAYKLECEDFHICFMNKKIEKTAPINVRFISSFLWQYNYKIAFELFKKWFENAFQSKIIKVQISRLDICCDIDEISFNSNDSKKIITRARKREIMNVDSQNYEGKVFSGFTIAKGSPLMCRIYNKTLEIKKSNKVWFEDIWKQYGWNGKEVWRIEFQARRKILKELRVETINDIVNNFEGLWAYYTQNWCTMRQPNKDINMSRWKICKKWETVQKINNIYNLKPLLREKIKRGDEETLLDLCLGSLTSLSAIKGFNNEKDAYKYLSEKIKKRNRKKNTTYEKEVAKKKDRYIKS